MRRFSLVLLAVLLTRSAVAQSIVIPPPRMRVMTNRADLATVCATNNRIFGCTAFAGEKLFCYCEREGDKWRVHATAQFIPFIYLYARHLDGIAHEHLHIDDVHHSLTRYLDELQSRAFDSPETCAQETELESSRFSKRMNEWKVASNLERHPELRQESRW